MWIAITDVGINIFRFAESFGFGKYYLVITVGDMNFFAA